MCATCSAMYEPTRLLPVSYDGALRGPIFAQAAAAFAPRLQMPVPAPPGAEELEDARFSRPLYLHAAALAAVEGLPLTADSLIGEIVAHEQRIWEKRYQDQHGDDDFDAAEFTAGCSHFMAAVTLHGGLATKAEAERMLNLVGHAPEKHLLRFLRSLYPGSRTGGSAYLSGLEPDLLGELLVRQVLNDPETPAAYLDRVFADANEAALRSGFIILGRIALAGESHAAAWLESVLAADVPARARATFDAAMTLSERGPHAPLGRILAASLEREGTVELAQKLDPLVPDETVSLREVAAWAAGRLLRALPAAGGDEAVTVERARLLNNLSVRLSELGRREDALAAAEKAMAIWRELAAARPDAFRPVLALSLNSLGVMLSALGRREAALAAAEEATAIYRELAAARPDAFLPDLALSLNSLGVMLSELGRREAALAAAEEATAIRRALAAARPDAFGPDLATSLNNLGNSLSALGHCEDALAAAEEAVGIYRALAATRPEAFRPDLARSLGRLGQCLTGLDRPRDALDAFHDGVAALQQPFLAYPPAFAGLMAALIEDYRAVVEEIRDERDTELLAPILQVLQKLSGEQDT
jgi:tetratricopeptide (TPR) repeat protein